ncbi:MAG: transcriptional regulator [Candidatus Heimdallarchaeota archaeon]
MNTSSRTRSPKKPRFKKLVQPQEVVVWYVLPAIRREITQTLINEHNMPQKEIAKRFYLTEPAISQYKKSRRGQIGVEFDEIIQEKIQDAAHNIAVRDSSAPHEVQRVLKYIEKSGFLCTLHKKFGLVHEDCGICDIEIY